MLKKIQKEKVNIGMYIAGSYWNLAIQITSSQGSSTPYLDLTTPDFHGAIP